MSHGVMGTQNMAFPNNSRSFTGLGSTKSQENKSNADRGLAGLGSLGGGSTWGSNSIWSGGITSSLNDRSTSRDTSRSRDNIKGTSTGPTKNVPGKTGSGSLVESSVSDDDAYITAFNARRNLNTGRSTSQVQPSDGSLGQQRTISNTGIPHAVSGVNQNGTFAHRPAVNLNSSASAQPRPNYNSAFPSATCGRSAEQPPFTVYTKFDRPSDPFQRKPDSAVGGSWADSSATPSPTDERKPQFPPQFNRTASLPVSRDGSLASSRQADEQPLFHRSDYSRSMQQMTPASSRAPSFSSSRNGAYSNCSAGAADQMVMHFGAMTINDHSSRPGTSYKQSSLSNGYSTLVPATSKALTQPRHTFQDTEHGVDIQDEIEEINRSRMNHVGLNDFASSQHQPTNFTGYSGATFAERFPHAAANFEFRPGQPFNCNSTTGLSSHTYDNPNGPRSAADWSALGNAAMSTTRKSAALVEQSPFMDPRLQQMMAAQLRQPYATTMLSPYAIPHAVHFNTANPYLGLVPLQIPALDAQLSHDDTCENSIQSALMYEFKSNTKTKRYELRDIYDHIAEFAGDQHGSRFIQTKLETANSDEKERVFREIEPNATQLMTDVFGNYVIQKFFEHGDQTHKKILANKMRGQVLSLSKQMYGCRVVQKALDHILVDQQASLIRELENHVIVCVKDQNGNHVIQKAIERCPSANIGFIVSAFRGQVQVLSVHPYGCRVIQRCLEKSDLPAKGMIMEELMASIQMMITDQYGNYVVQHIVTHDDGHAKKEVLSIVARGLETFSKHKFASNVVEKCIERADNVWRREVVFTLVDANSRRLDGEGVLAGMIKDSFGNYVIQKLLDTLIPEDYCFFVDNLHVAFQQAKRTSSNSAGGNNQGKQVLSIERKLHKFPGYPRLGGGGGVGHLPAGGAPGGTGQYFHPHHHAQHQQHHTQPQYQHLSLPTPPFLSNFPSAATTPPPLTAGTQSVQSSALPSINGDTIEGAAPITGLKGSQ